ncbi:MAG: spore germination protein [Thermosediminibacterales bacterium]|nr:spore germination protein [Thermosediminibacterales bacterium]
MLLLTNSGCWSRVEIEDLAVVLLIGLDKAKEESKVRVTVQLARPEEIAGAVAENGSTTKKASWVTASTGDSIYDAQQNLAMHVSRELFWAHTRAIIIGEELAKEGIAPVIDFVDRRRDLRRRIGIAVVKGEARELLEAEPGLEKTSGQVYSGLLVRLFRHSKAAISDLRDIYEMLTSKGIHPTTSRIELVKLKDEKNTKKQPKLTGTAVFRDDKLIGWLDEAETRGFLLLKRKKVAGVFPVKCPVCEEKNVNIVLTRSYTSIKPQLVNGELIITVQIKAEGDVREQMCRDDLSRPEIIEALNQRLAQAIKAEVIAAQNKAQKNYQVDIFGFGEAVRRKFPKLWQKIEHKWDEEFPELPVKISIEAKIRRLGMILEPTTKP